MLNNINKDEEIITRSKREIIMKLLTYLKPYKLKSFFVVLDDICNGMRYSKSLIIKDCY